MIPIYFCMGQKKNMFLELSSQGQFPGEKKNPKKTPKQCFENSLFQFNG